MGQVQMLRGLYKEALKQFEQARTFTESDLVTASIDCRIGELYFKVGDMQNSAKAIESACAAIGHPVPGNIVTLTLKLGRESFTQMLHSVLPKLFVGRRGDQMDPKDRLLMHLHSVMAHVYWFSRGQVACLWTHLREMNLAERYAPSLEMAQAYSEHAPVMSTLPLNKRGNDYARKSHEIRESYGDLWGCGQSKSFWALVAYGASNFEDTVNLDTEAIKIFEQTGDWWEANLARYQRGLAHFRLGKLEEAIEDSHRVHRSGLELGDAQASGITLHTWVMAAQGNVPAEIIATELERPRHDFQVIAQVMMAESVRLIYCDQFDEAIESLQNASRVVAKHGLRSAYVSPVPVWLSTAIRKSYLSTTDSAKKSKRLRQLKRAVRNSLVTTWFFRNDYPHALRESAELAFILNKPQKGMKRLTQSIAVANEINSAYEAALSQVRYCESKQLVGMDESADEIAAAKQKLNDFLPKSTPQS